MPDALIACFATLGIADVPRVGGKNASLGELPRALAGEGVNVPAGFATTAEADLDDVAANGIEKPLRARVAALEAGEASLQETSEAIRRLFIAGRFAIGAEVTLSCAEGEQGHVYAGRLDFALAEIDLADLPHARTAMMLNFANPAAALR
jgi:phosphoenolpyruvate synthase/pyruvate phosphate dikinase